MTIETVGTVNAEAWGQAAGLMGKLLAGLALREVERGKLVMVVVDGERRIVTPKEASEHGWIDLISRDSSGRGSTGARADALCDGDLEATNTATAGVHDGRGSAAGSVLGLGVVGG